MAVSATTAAQAELISSLSQDDIPIKLRCAICSRLAVNAFRLPCCEQAICETCQSTLPSSCPVCEHTPVAAEDCKPNKSLRTTIKVFLRTEEKKREALRLKETKNSAPATPLEVTATPVEASTPAEAIEPNVAGAAETKSEPSSAPTGDQVEEPPANVGATEQAQQAEADIPQPSIEEITPGQEPTEETVETNANSAEDTVAEKEKEQTDENGANDQSTTGQDVSQTPGFGTGFGFDSSAAGGFPAMGFGGDFNQMQMMMMQNGMAPNAFGSFPMMGMPGMSMDPMMMQNMFMNGGFGAAGMNGMNMNMGAGMGGFDGGVGAGFNNGWNGQQSWNIGPDNFNHPNASGMGTGDYGSNNSGFASHAARYNQGNYGRGNQYNDYQNQNYGYQQRGRGRGRGGFGRGGYGYGSNEAFSQQFPQQFGSGEGANGAMSDTASIPNGPKADAAQATPSNVDEFGREIRQTSEAKDGASAEPASKDDNTPAPPDNDGTEVNQDAVPKDTSAQPDDFTPKPIQTLDEIQAPFVPNGFHGMYGPSRGGFGPGFPGRGGFNSMQPPPVKPVDVPLNAPTGPKAMREGLPNTGLSGLRGRAAFMPSVGRPSSVTNGSMSAPPEPEPSDKDGKERERSRSPSREKSKERSRSRERRRSRSRDRHHRRHRHRSTSLSEDEKESERRRQRRRERRRRREEEEADDHEDHGSRERYADDDGRDVEDERSRSASPSDSKRSSHRSRRDRDKYRERDRESDREYKSSSHKHRSSHRHRDDRSRSRDRDHEHRHRHTHRGSEDPEDRAEKTDKSIPPTPLESEDAAGRPSTSSNATNGIEIKGASSRRKTALDEVVIPTGPRQDRLSGREREKERDKGRESRHHRDDDDSRHRSSRHHNSDRERERERERAKDKEREKDRARAAPTAPAVQDPHTLEREARNRERLLKEAQRIAGLTAGMAGARKRSRDDGDDARKGRKKGRRGTGSDESDEARIARLEAERESARWD